MDLALTILSIFSAAAFAVFGMIHGLCAYTQQCQLDMTCTPAQCAASFAVSAVFAIIAARLFLRRIKMLAALTQAEHCLLDESALEEYRCLVQRLELDKC
ncbi:hypothetical protein BJ741DRAFT_637257 [Chytriomyces cf. hyalinus JEL632]|nr:hypothetical protein BJ741DRAFT_637257 [Chytriomyces cf. hyalinus JEL632]